MSEELKVIKKMDPATCPHCQKEIFISSQSVPATVYGVSTKNDMDLAKKDIIERIDEIKFVDEMEREKIVQWLNAESTLIDRTDTEPLIKQIQIEQLEKITNNKNEKKDNN